MSMESRLTERQFFMLSLAGLSALILVLFFAVLRPRIQERALLREEVKNKTSQLQTAGYLLGEAALLQKKRQVELEVQQRLQEWKEVTGHLASFANQEEWQSQDVTKIDYKTYLHYARIRLIDKARKQRIKVPTDLGMIDLIESNDVAREKMLQLLTVEKLVDTAIEYGIADIRSIAPLSPVVHSVEGTDIVYMEEFPLQVMFEGPMTGLVRLWEAMFQKDRAMLLRNIAMEKTSLRNADEVRMTATLSSFLFLEEAQNLDSNLGKPAKRTRATGH
ncbi:hypothetical protein P0Y35_02050 [Kiritimatiellaeota bacterium B1221]|nr:hypothetical protein [Kiritimatiellaeota bacterium B1221]